MTVAIKPDAPHKAVIFVQAEIFEIIPTTGECGRSAYKIEKFPVVISGTDKFDAIKKLNETLDELKRTCQCRSQN